MTKPFIIDPIPVREGLERLTVRAGTIESGIEGGKALVWFAEYASNPQAITVKADVVAGSTPGAGIAKRYVQAAAIKFAPFILESAIAAAREDFDAANRDPEKKS